MNEIINFGLGIEATVAATIVFVLRTIVLFFSITTTIIVLRNFFIVSGREASDKVWTLLPSNVWRPTILWTIFFILTALQNGLS